MDKIKARIALILAAAFVLSACNTMEGVGRDVEKAGEGIQRGADRR